MPPAPPTHQALPQWVDARKFAYQGVHLDGEVQLALLPRLNKTVLDSVRPVHAALDFSVDEQRHRLVSGPVNTRLSVICQRCLQPMEIEVDAELSVAVVAGEDEAQHLPRHLEPWLVTDPEGQADLYEVIEDELLLSLPMVAYHEHQCIDESLYSSGTPDPDHAGVEDRNNPFQVLNKLKSNGPKGR